MQTQNENLNSTLKLFLPAYLRAAPHIQYAVRKLLDIPYAGESKAKSGEIVKFPACKVSE